MYLIAELEPGGANGPPTLHTGKPQHRGSPGALSPRAIRTESLEENTMQS